MSVSPPEDWTSQKTFETGSPAAGGIDVDRLMPTNGILAASISRFLVASLLAVVLGFHYAIAGLKLHILRHLAAR